MALTTSIITGRVPLPNDNPIAYAELLFSLSGLDTEGGDVLLPGGAVRAVLVNSEMPAGFDLWRNTEGGRGTSYALLARWVEITRDGKIERFAQLPSVQVGDNPTYALADLINAAPVPTPANTYWSTITQSQYDAAIAAVAAVAADRVQTGLDRVSTTASAASAAAARDAALLSRGVFASTAAGLSNGVVNVSGLVGGTGGANGTWPLAFTGGAGINAAGVFTVAGGIVTQVTITNPGTGYTSAPAISFAASAGLTGASAVAVIGARNPVGSYFSVAGGAMDVILYRVDTGPVAVEVGRYPTAAALESAVPNGTEVIWPTASAVPNGWYDTMDRLTFGAKSKSVISNFTVGRALFRAGELGLVYDPSDLSTLFQDVAGTIPVTTPGQTVARMLDSSGNLRHATQSDAAKRPVYGREPKTGVRNRATGSAAVTNAFYWPSSNTTNGITLTKLGQGIDTDGLPYVDVQYTGIATNTFTNETYFSDASKIPAVSGQTWTTSAYLQVIAGAVPRAGSGLQIVAAELNAGGGYLAGTGVTHATGVETLVQATRVLNNGATTQARAQVTFAGLVAADVVDVTYRIKGLQFEAGAVRTAYQANVSQFDITEAGVPSLRYLAADGIDDFMSLASAVSLGSAYTVCWAMDSTNRRFLGGSDATIESFGNNGSALHNVTAVDRFRWESLTTVSGSRVDFIRAASLAIGMYSRNGVDAGTPSQVPTVPMGALTDLFRRTSSYMGGKFFGGFAVNRAISPSETAAALAFYAAKTGVTLP